MNLRSPRILQYVFSFSDPEKRDFERYIGSPFFNRDTSLIKLYAYILNYGKEFNKQHAYKYVFGDKTYKEQRINNMMTQLVHHVQEFLSYTSFKKNKSLTKESLLVSLREKQAKKNFNVVYARSDNKADTGYDSGLYYSKYKTAVEADKFMLQEGIRKKNKELQSASDNLDAFYLTEKLRLACEMLNRKNIIGAEYDAGAFELVKEYIEKNPNKYKTLPAVLIYRCIYQTLANDSLPGHFIQLQKLLREYATSFSAEEARHMYDFAENYCIKKVNTGHTEYLKEVQSLYEQLIRSGLILNKGVIAESDYKNIVAISLRLGKHSWTHDFIVSHKDRLPEQQQQNAYTYNIALYHYTVKDYKNAVRSLRDVEFTDVFYQLGSKLILLKVYYETEEVESFYSLIDSFKIYLHRNKQVSIYQKQSYQNLLRFAKNCFDLKIKPPVNRKQYIERLNRIETKISENKNIVSFIWLNERLSELKR